MDDQKMLFRTCRNYKMGIYVFNSVKRGDFIVVMLFVLIAFVIMFFSFQNESTLLQGALIAALVGGIPIYLVLPLAGFHSIYYRLYFLVRYIFSNKIWIYEGRILEETSYGDDDDE